MSMSRQRPAVLGIVDGLHDAGAALVRDGVILAAANEERFTRRKLQGGWPTRSIRAVMARITPLEETRSLVRADVDLTKLRFYLRLCHDLKMMTPRQYQHVAGMVSEIGRLLGGWRKTITTA